MSQRERELSSVAGLLEKGIIELRRTSKTCEFILESFRVVRKTRLNSLLTSYRITLLGLAQNLAHDASAVTPKSLVLRARQFWYPWMSSTLISFYSETRKTYRAILFEPRIVLPTSSSEPTQTTAPSTTATPADAQSSTTNGPATEPSVPALHPLENSQECPSATKKRPREPDSDMAGPAATSERPKATAAAADHDAADSGPARKKKKKKDGDAKK